MIKKKRHTAMYSNMVTAMARSDLATFIAYSRKARSRKRYTNANLASKI